MSLQKHLYQLYLLDKQVRGIKRRLESTTSRLNTQQTILDQVTCQHKELTQQTKLAQARSSSLEHQAADLDQRVEELRHRMNSVTNNKEYSALLVEVGTMKAQMGKVEDEALEQLNQAEMFEQEMKQLQQQMTDRQKLVDVATTEATACREEFGEQLNDLTAQRDMAQRELPQQTQVIFNRLCDHSDGEALAEVIEEDRRRMTYICGGCYMNVPFEHINTLLSRPNDLVCCTSCGRIMYLDQKLKASMAVK